MPPARRTIALGLVVGASLLSLAACEKPTPGVTVNSSGSTSRVEAVCWSRTSAPVQQSQCQAQRIGKVTVSAGQTIGISVDTQVADTGWVVLLGQNSLVNRPIKKTYYRLAVSAQDLAQASLQLQVVALTSGQRPRGLWRFELRQS